MFLFILVVSIDGRDRNIGLKTDAYSAVDARELFQFHSWYIWLIFDIKGDWNRDCIYFYLVLPAMWQNTNKAWPYYKWQWCCGPKTMPELRVSYWWEICWRNCCCYCSSPCMNFYLYRRFIQIRLLLRRANSLFVAHDSNSGL